MLRRPSRVPRALRVVVLGALVAGLAWVIAAGCKEGQPPYQVIPENGTSDQYLPPGAVLGTSEAPVGLIYNFNRTLYRLFRPLPETDPRFIKRDSVLAFASAPDLIHPDSDPTLAQVYANPRLFGFKASDAAQSDVFVEGRKPSWNTSEYLPLQPGNHWEQIHNQREWVVIDSIVGSATAPTTQQPVAMPAFQMHSTYTARSDLGSVFYKPAQYTAEYVLTSDPSHGLYHHAWTLISERVVIIPPNQQPDRQRNPRFLWLSINSIASFTGNPQAQPPVAIDQCLDNLPSELEQYPVKFTGAQVQEGQVFTTWTYLGVDDAVLRQRLNSEAQVPGGGRCGFPIPIGTDTLEMFPTHTFKLLAKYEVRVDRILDQVELKIGTQTIGRYPNQPEDQGILKIIARMFVANQTVETPVQYLEIYYLRGIGEVIRTTGVDPSRRSNARLRSCTVNGTFYPPNNSRFFYAD